MTFISVVLLFANYALHDINLSSPTFIFTTVSTPLKLWLFLFYESEREHWEWARVQPSRVRGKAEWLISQRSRWIRSLVVRGNFRISHYSIYLVNWSYKISPSNEHVCFLNMWYFMSHKEQEVLYEHDITNDPFNIL